jgi:hypothetical protein
VMSLMTSEQKKKEKRTVCLDVSCTIVGRPSSRE